MSSVHFVKCDVRVWSEQLAAFKSALENSPNGNVDIVIANAGIAAKDSIMVIGMRLSRSTIILSSLCLSLANSESDDSDEPQEPDLSIAEINISGVLYTAKLSLHYFAKSPSPPQEKCLILKSSIAGYLDLPSAPSYQTSKYAVRGLMCNLRRAGRCRVNVVAPWFINTPIMSAAIIEQLGPALKNMNSNFADVDDSVKAVLRLACDETINGMYSSQQIA